MKTGSLYYIKFRDHFIDGEEGENPIMEAIGWLVEENNTYIKLTYWRCKSAVGDMQFEKSSMEIFSVLKSTIIKRKIVKINMLG